MRIDYIAFEKMFFSKEISNYRSPYTIILIHTDEFIDLDFLIDYLYTTKNNDYFIFADADYKEEFLQKIIAFLKSKNINYSISMVPYEEGFNKKEYLYNLLQKNRIVYFDGKVYFLEIKEVE